MDTAAQRNLFFLPSNGLCFLCFGKSLSKIAGNEMHSSSDDMSTSFHSLHQLHNYLQFNFAEVINEGSEVLPESMTLMKKSELRVELCEACLGVSQKFAELYHQLEQIQLQVDSCLKTISVRISQGNGKAGNVSVTECNNVEIVKRLRRATLAKCDLKLLNMDFEGFQGANGSSEPGLLSPVGNSYARDETVRCPTCFKQFSSKYFLDLHEKQYHNSGEERKKKKKKKKQFPNRANFQNNQQDQDGQVQRQRCACPHCGTTFSQTASLWRHKRLYCAVLKSSGTSGSNAAGMQNSIGGGRKFKQPQGTKRRYACEHCSATFSHPSSLPRHQKMYCAVIRNQGGGTPAAAGPSAAARPSASPQKTPTNKSSPSKEPVLLSSVELGSPGKSARAPHTCTICKHELRSLMNLRIHHEAVHLGIRYPCTICKQTFTQKSSLNRHYKTNHKDEVIPSTSQGVADENHPGVPVKAEVIPMEILQEVLQDVGHFGTGDHHVGVDDGVTTMETVVVSEADVNSLGDHDVVVVQEVAVEDVEDDDEVGDDVHDKLEVKLEDMQLIAAEEVVVNEEQII